MESLSGFKLELQLDGVNWTDKAADVLLGDGHEVRCRYGNWSTSLLDLMAQSGNLAWDMDNGSSNANATPAYYTPGHANCVSGFAKGVRVRFSVSKAGVTYYKFVGRMRDLIPSVDPLDNPVTSCTAVDWLEYAVRTKVSRLAVASDKRLDEGATTLLTGLSEQPGDTSFDTGIETFESLFDMEDDQADTIYSILSKMVRSELGRGWLIGDTTQGGTLRLMNRHGLIISTLSEGTLDEEMDELEIEDGDNKVYNILRVKIWPRRYDATASVLATLVAGDNYLSIGPGESAQIQLYFRDPSGSNRISGKDITDPLVADDNYKFGSSGNGTSNDMNGDVSFTTTEIGGNSVFYVVKNNSIRTMYVNKFEVDGIGIYPYDPDIYEVNDGAGDVAVDFDMPYMQNKNTMRVIGDWLASKVSSTMRKSIRSIGFNANKSATLMDAALTGEPGTRWEIISAHVGVSNEWFVNGVEYVLTGGLRLDVSWCCIPVDDEAAWVLATSELSSTTVLVV